MSPLAEEALHLREMFIAMVAGGFTEDQALRLIAYTLHANRDPNPSGDSE
jgi:hypothetical protein